MFVLHNELKCFVTISSYLVPHIQLAVNGKVAAEFTESIDHCAAA